MHAILMKKGMSSGRQADFPLFSLQSLNKITNLFTRANLHVHWFMTVNKISPEHHRCLFVMMLRPIGEVLSIEQMRNWDREWV
jgi:hypothetical protein